MQQNTFLIGKEPPELGSGTPAIRNNILLLAEISMKKALISITMEISIGIAAQ